MKSIIELERERLEWSLKTFPEATAISSLRKLEEELKEVEEELNQPSSFGHLAEEYADCLMCIFDSAGRAGVTLEMIRQSYEIKLEKNKKRVWKKNADNSYSHIK